MGKVCNDRKRSGFRVKKAVILVLCAGMILTYLAGCGKKEEALTEEEKFAILKEAVIYTLPLMLMDATSTKMTNTVHATSAQAPVNQFIHAAKLADASSRNVVTPNADTVYSQIFLDLNSEDGVIVELPKTDRFCTAQVLDAYTNCVTIIDCTSFEKETEKFIFTLPDFKGEIPSDVTRIECPTSLSWILVRTLCNGEEDMGNIREIQSGMKSYTLEMLRHHTEDEAPLGNYDEKHNFIPVQYVLSLSPSEYFDRAVSLMIKNPPAPEDKEIVERMSRINIGPECKFSEALFGDSLLEEWEAIRLSLVEDCSQVSLKFAVKNGVWNYFGDPIARFGTEYEYRCLVALVGLGANPTELAVYPKAQEDCDGNRLTGEHSYVIHLDTLPETKENGFWSISVYHSADNLFIDNEIDRYCINDRNDLVYNEDGSLDIYVQSVPPDENRISNWLPVGRDEFHLYMRIYMPADSVRENSWHAPVIIMIKE